MHYYDHYHDPNSHPQLARQREDELLRAANRCEVRPGIFTRLRSHLRGAVPAQAPGEDVTILAAEIKKAEKEGFEPSRQGFPHLTP